jgi:hypothetical protein
MSDDAPVRALDAAAWAAVAAWRDPINDPADAIGALVSRAEPPRFDAVMALANAALRDEHPVKLDHDDVRAILEAAVAAHLAGDSPSFPDDVREVALRRAERLRATARKLAAILPPQPSA